jgi:hypothetical protein
MSAISQSPTPGAPQPADQRRSWWRGLAWRILFYGLLVYLGLLLYLYFHQERLIYLPDTPGRRLTATPDQAGLDYQPVTLTTEDGVKLDGWFLPHDSPRASLLFFHGNAGNISHRLASLKLFHELGLEVLIFDYRGYGRSEGEPSEDGTYRDADAAWRYLTETRNIPAEQILLLGRSFGGALAAYTASRQGAMGLVLESTFSSAPEMAAWLFPWAPARWLTRYRYDTRSRLAELRMPLLVIHSREDELIPYAQGEALYRAGRSPKRLLSIDGGHNDGWLRNARRYIRALDEFIDLCRNRPPNQSP